MRRILYLNFCHGPFDPRLRYREMRLLKSHDPSCALFFFKVYPGSEGEKDECIRRVRGGVEVNECNVYAKDDHLWRSQGCLLTHKEKYAAIAAALSPTVVQASDARELALAHMICRSTGAKLIYDSHEDYFNQVFEYLDRSAKALVAASLLHFEEIRFVRKCDAVFCTDEFLLERYKKGIYCTSNVSLLRNFAYAAVPSNGKTFVQKHQLDLVYVGGVNKWRGVSQCAEFCARFNRENPPRRLTLTIYSPEHPLVSRLLSYDCVQHVAWIDYPELMSLLPQYDVGTCLWQPIRKFHRNLAVKNFDYMACGLPIITSNFGNLRKYIDESGAGLAIDPTNYQAFKDAIDHMFDPQVRRQFSEAGVAWVANKGNFVREGEFYAQTMLS